MIKPIEGKCIEGGMDVDKLVEELILPDDLRQLTVEELCILKAQVKIDWQLSLEGIRMRRVLTGNPFIRQQVYGMLNFPSRGPK